MFRINYLIIMLCFITKYSFSQTTNEFMNLFVSLNGNDKWSGKLPSPNKQNTDGPFRSIERAKNEIRLFNKNGEKNKLLINVELRKGIYNIDETLDFDSLDSGNQNIEITYRNFDNEEVHITGGIRLSNFKNVADKNILKQLSIEAANNVMCVNLKDFGIKDLGDVAISGNWFELYFDNQPMTLARWPNSGFYTFNNFEFRDTTLKSGSNKIIYTSINFNDKRIKKWINKKNVWLHGYWYWNWSDGYEKVSSFDTTRNKIILAPPFNNSGYKIGQRFYVENILSELDTTGEWYLDRNSYELYFWPPADISEKIVYIPKIQSLIRMKNISNVEFDGIIFEVTKGDCITINNANNIGFKNCIIRNAGGYGILEKSVRNCYMENCDIYYLADGGIWLDGGDRKDLIPANNLITCCKIHDFSLLNRTYRPGINLFGVGNIVEKNEIYNAPANAILMQGNEHIIEYNFIHDVCYETRDVGAIYSGRDWTMRGSEIKFNLFVNIIPRYSYLDSNPVSSVYLDDGMSGILIYNNIFYRVNNAIYFNGGRDNSANNNIFIDCQTSLIINPGVDEILRDAYLIPRLDSMPYKGPKWAKKYPSLVNILNENPTLAHGNKIINNICYKSSWFRDNSSHHSLLVFKNNLFQNNLIDVNPGFYDTNNMDFRIKVNSPAQNIGFSNDIIAKIAK